MLRIHESIYKRLWRIVSISFLLSLHIRQLSASLASVSSTPTFDLPFTLRSVVLHQTAYTRIHSFHIQIIFTSSSMFFHLQLSFWLKTFYLFYFPSNCSAFFHMSYIITCYHPKPREHGFFWGSLEPALDLNIALLALTTNSSLVEWRCII